MQLGARWAVGDPPHRSVPAALHAAIAEQEALRPGANSWTLTWLEGRAQVTLDGQVTITAESTASAPTDPDADDDTWLD